MLRSLLKFGVLLVIGVLVYNFFFGSSTEKEQSKKVFGETKVLFHSVRDLVKGEREKFDAGKYDNAVSKVKNVFGKLRETANDNKDVLTELDDLDKKRQAIEERLAKIKKMADDVPSNYDAMTEKGGKTTTKPTPRIQNPKTKPPTLKADEEQKLQGELDDLMNRTNKLMDKMEEEKQ